MISHSLYLHIPFCRHRCGYCDFNTYAGLDSLVPQYVRALCAEMVYLRNRLEHALPVHTVFLGGGTPSLLPIAELENILGTLMVCFNLHPQAEVSLEANPGTVSLEYLRSLHALGINRLSLGMQTASPEELRLLEREHDFQAVIEAVSWSRRAGFDNLNLDLIFGLPYQALSSWQRSLELAIGLCPEHLSLYSLTLEHGTPLGRWAERGLICEPDSDNAAEMYEWSMERLERSGYEQYEISNWAVRRDGQLLSCSHNLQYWRNQPYLGLGAGAHGYAGGIRTANVLAPAAYIQRLLSSGTQDHSFPVTPATQSTQLIDQQAEIAETMMTGLRLVEEGVSSQDFRERFGLTLQDVFPVQIDRLIQIGLIEWSGEGQERLRLTRRGRLLGNQVFVEFI